MSWEQRMVERDYVNQVPVERCVYLWEGYIDAKFIRDMYAFLYDMALWGEDE